MSNILSIKFYSSIVLFLIQSTSFVKKVNNDIEKLGIQMGMNKTVTDTHSKVSVGGLNNDVRKIFQKKPCVLIANHPHKSGAVALISVLPKREDILLIMNADSIMLRIFPSIKKYSIPVYIDYHTREIYGRKGVFFNTLMNRNKDSLDKSHLKNIESLKLAQKTVEESGMIIMYPDGGGKGGKWFDGIGFLLNSIKNSDEVYVIMASVGGVSLYDIFRIIPGVSKIMRPISVRFSNPILVKNLIKKSPKSTKSSLESEYKTWALAI